MREHRKNIQEVFVKFQNNLIGSILISSIVRGGMDGAGNERNANKNKVKRGPQYSNNDKSHIIY